MQMRKETFKKATIRIAFRFDYQRYDGWRVEAEADCVEKRETIESLKEVLVWHTLPVDAFCGLRQVVFSGIAVRCRRLSSVDVRSSVESDIGKAGCNVPFQPLFLLHETIA